MSRSITSPLHAALVDFIIRERKAAHLTQVEVARVLGRHQSFVATIESGQRRIDIVDLFDLAHAIGFTPTKAVEYVRESVEAMRP